MNNVARNMDFDVYTDLKNKNQMYNVKIELENEVDSNTRECAIALAGTVVRNNFKMIYGKVLDDEELAINVKEKLNTWVPRETDFKAKNVSLSLKRENKR